MDERYERLGQIIDINFESGEHMLRWSATTRQVLLLTEQLLMGARVEVRASLAHRRWRWGQGELPPRVRAAAVTLHLVLLIASLRAAITAMDGFARSLNRQFVDPARQTRAARPTGGGAGA